MLTGTIDEGATGAASLSGTGVVAGFAGVSCMFTGMVLDGELSGTVTWGAGNELPSCGPDSGIKFMITGIVHGRQSQPCGLRPVQQQRSKADLTVPVLADTFDA